MSQKQLYDSGLIKQERPDGTTKIIKPLWTGGTTTVIKNENTEQMASTAPKKKIEAQR